MKIGLHISDFTFANGPSRLAEDLTRVVVAAEDAGFARVSVMDHVWQISVHGPPEHEMLEAYTTLGYIAARTSQVDLLAWVTAVTYRDPGMLAKIISTLDVLSAGRAWLGIGAAWNEEEARGLGLSFPPLAERFERLEEALQICRQMWDPDGRRSLSRRALPASTARSMCPSRCTGRGFSSAGAGSARPSGWSRSTPTRATCSSGQNCPRKLDVLRGHCEAVGRPYDEIEKTGQMVLDLGERGEKIDEFLATLAEIGKLGIQAVQGKVPQVWEPERLALFEREVIPAAADL